VLDALSASRHEGSTRRLIAFAPNAGASPLCGLVTGPRRARSTVDLRGAIAAVSRAKSPAIVDPGRIGELMRAIAATGRRLDRIRPKLLPLTFVRPGELRLSEWSEFNLKASEWRIQPRA